MYSSPFRFNLNDFRGRLTWFALGLAIGAIGMAFVL